MKTLAFSMLRAAARRTLPTSMRQFLVDRYLTIQAARKGTLAKQFAARPTPLATFPPAFKPRDFASGPVVMVNNALAAGGVERQIVNTLRVLGQRTDRSFGLLCLRLGEEPHFDFFRPLLDSFPGFVRNATSAAQANRVLATMLPTSTSKRLRLAIGWMPSDVQQEVLRFAAEFATLKPSVVHAWQDGTGIATIYAARMIGVPRTMISTRNVRPTNFGWYRPYMYHAHGEIARCPDIVMINNSQAGANDYANWLGIPVNRFVVKRNGLDTATIRRANPSAVADLRGRLGIPRGASIIGSIFQILRRKKAHALG